ncbi:Coq4 family protein [Paraliomyxa miuraensis]|uniref:Coq4 family protein n=1 Tax=Paraliomyxa miuraensis TaxID=376150 RepID=UPI0022559B13|nr:Coq4 family protein [Paraliomyxa miuraensis]MCX4247349.1 Coq4 family protein [Paraliomyxa miuraensis]
MTTMTRWQLLSEMRAAMKDPARFGDAAVYKAELGRSRARPEIEAQLGDVRGYFPRVDLEALAELPDGTFGREYARFLEVNRLHPIIPTDQVDPEMIARNAFTVRYAIIHDMVHVLTGFDTSWPGEAGVWAFVGAQRYSFIFDLAGVMSLLVAPFMCPLRLRQAWRSWRRGRAMGKQARLLLILRLEERLEQRLSDVRAELGIEGAGDGYLPHAPRAAHAAG